MGFVLNNSPFLTVLLYGGMDAQLCLPIILETEQLLKCMLQITQGVLGKTAKS